MGNVIKNDHDLTYLMTSFFRRLKSACDRSDPIENYLAHAAGALCEQECSFFSTIPVHHYGHLVTPCVDDLPFYIYAEKIADQVMEFVDNCRQITLIRNDNLANFRPSSHARYILNPDQPVSVYSTSYEDGIIWIGKRHPYRIAQQSLNEAALHKSDRLYDKALNALQNYVFIDTSLFEINKRVAQCYEDNWGEDNNAPCKLSDLAKMFDPYAKKANPDLDYRYREKLITHELITNLANQLS